VSTRHSALGARLAALFIVFLATSSAHSQDAPEPVSAGQVYWDEAIELYGDREYEQAIPIIVQAIQADPTDPRYYRGLARAAHFAEQYALAVRYYDLYLEHFVEHAQAERSRDNREEAIRRERERANGQRENPQQPIERAPAQVAALATLDERLANGPFLSPDGVGAYAMFQTVLRTGYAEPYLADVRARLASGLLEETEALFLPGTASAVPTASLDDWRLVPQRLEVLVSLGTPELEPQLREARLAAARGQVFLINANYDLAVEEFTAASTSDPDLLMPYWGLLLAQHGQASYAGRPVTTDSMALVDRLETMVRERAPQQIPLIHIARSIVWYDMARHEEAAESLMRLLAP